MSSQINDSVTGSRKEFDNNWKQREEAQYNHWCKHEPNNQIQLAFYSHWQVFKETYPEIFCQPGKVLEVGCGRGSMSSHFAENGWECSLLDYSQSVLDVAKKIFSNNKHEAEFISGDARDLPFEDNQYDAVVSIGLLEHFEEVDVLIEEQCRVLKSGGVFLGYVVPERPDNVQKYFNWINSLVSSCYKLFSKSSKNSPKKQEVYRSDLYSPRYLEVINRLDVNQVKSFGMYPMPMISHSPEFPFSLMHPIAEKLIVNIFNGILSIRRFFNGKHGWICSEEVGQAFLVSFVKK